MLAAVLLLIAAADYPVIEYRDGYEVIEYQSAEQPATQQRETFTYKVQKYKERWWCKDESGNWLVHKAGKWQRPVTASQQIAKQPRVTVQRTPARGRLL